MSIENSALDVYQKEAFDFAMFNDMQVYPFLALAEEAGEVCGKYAKFIRKEGYEPDFIIPSEVEHNLREDLIKELGDVMWQLAACSTIVGVNLSEIAERNLEKLRDRLKRGKIVGEGDNR